MSTTPSFDPSKLGNTGGGQSSSKKKQSERVIMVVTGYETPSDGAHFAVGHRFDNPNDLVKVRLTTVKERLADKPDLTEDNVKALYLPGDNARETIETKAKNRIKLISFDDSIFLGKENGVSVFRSHWPKTIAASADAELMHGQGHIRLHKEEKEKSKQAYIELLRSAAVANKDNIDQLFVSALDIKDSQGRARDPFMVMRVSLGDKTVAQPRIYPERELFFKFDQALGEEKESSRPVDVARTIATVMSGVAGRKDIETGSRDAVRAVVAGLKGDPEPTFASSEDASREKLRHLYYGVAQGALKVEVISAEKIDFGSDTRMTYLAKESGKPHMKAFDIKEPVPNKEGVFNVSPGFAPVAIGILRHPDGEPFAVYASPVKSYPYVKKLTDLSVESINRAALTKGADNVVDASQSAPVVTEKVEQSIQVGTSFPVDDGTYEEQYDAPGM